MARLGNSRVLDRHMNGVLEVSGINAASQETRTRSQQPRRLSPIEAPESYVYTTSGDYIHFPDQNPGDIGFIRNAAALVRARSGDAFGNSRRHSESALRNNGNGFIRTHSFENHSSNSPHTAIHDDSIIRGNEIPQPQRDSNSDRPNSQTRSAPRMERQGIDFSNLLRADVQRNTRQQTQSSTDRQSASQNGQLRTNQQPVANGNHASQQRRQQRSGDSSQYRLQQNGGSQSSLTSELSPSVQLTIGSITDEAGN